MPISTAHNGAVSDRSKLAVSFNIDHIVVTAFDIGGASIAQTVTNGGTAGTGTGSNPALPVSLIGLEAGGRIELSMQLTFADTGGSQRATGGNLILMGSNEAAFGGAPGHVINMLSHHENPEHPIAQGDLTGSIGFFQEARNGTFGFAEPYATTFPGPGGVTVVAGQQFIPDGSFDRLLIRPEEIVEGGALESIGQFRLERESIFCVDEKTGVYMQGPTDNFTFNIRITP